jgi:signal transduction histidine kinase
MGAELDTYLNQIAARLVFDPQGTARLDGRLADPRFDRIFSGLYWQITDERTQATIRSRSLWDTRLELPPDEPAVGAIDVHDAAGPADTRLLVHERRLAFDTPAGEKIFRLAVAVDRAEIAALSAAFATDVMRSLLLLAAVLLIAAWVQVSVGLRPLAAIRRGLNAIRGGKAERLEVEVPTEIAPLVDELNSLLEAQAKAMQRATDRAADLAHGFKTPLTALMSDAGRLRKKGESAIADEIERTAAQMRGQIDRELTRSRIRNKGTLGAIDLLVVANSIVATLRRTPKGENIAFDVDIDASLTVRMERDDLHDILGNLLENAVRHARSKVTIRAVRHGASVRVEIEDDGPGISEKLRDALIDRGKRLDSSPVGAGLGLAIVSELLDHYGQRLELGRSDLGGLKASFALAG